MALMQIKPEFAIGDVEQARGIVRAHPFATLVTADLRATHMPCLVDDSADDLAVIGHVARADPVAERLGGPLLAIFQGPHGYVSASWYEDETIPTWNYVILHLRGTPEVFDDAMPVLRRTVDHFEVQVVLRRHLVDGPHLSPAEHERPPGRAAADVVGRIDEIAEHGAGGR